MTQGGQDLIPPLVSVTVQCNERQKGRRILVRGGLKIGDPTGFRVGETPSRESGDEAEA